MPAANDHLLLKFRPRDSRLGVTRSTVKAMAAELGVPETHVVHLALAKLAEETLPAYEADDGPLTAKHLRAIRTDAAKHLPKGKVLTVRSLL